MNPVCLKVSVVICAYTEARWDYLREAVHSVERQSVPPDEIVVVVDHNVSLLKRVRAEIPGAVVVENREPRGLSGARNSGITAARGDIIAFMDEDAVAEPNWLARLRQHYDEGPHVLGVGGAIEPVWLVRPPAWFPEEFNWVVGCTYRGLPQTTAPVRNLIGCNMSFRREVFDAGGFRNGIGRIGQRPLGCEETELCIRIRQTWSTGRLFYEPNALVFHKVPRARATCRYFCSRCYSEGLSKALISRFVGARDGLASERAYVLRTLPQGVRRGVSDAFRRDWVGLARASVILLGLALTAAGYVAGLTAGTLATWRHPPARTTVPEVNLTR
jgi:glucosyl-dolichyl phosphate glucuronosyltransferase